MTSVYPPETWAERASTYNNLSWPHSENYMAEIRRAGRFSPYSSVLDVGTGTGIVARALRSRTRMVVALDSSADMLRNGSWDGIVPVRGDIRVAPFKARSFDRIVARMVFHHVLSGLERAIRNCYTMLRPGGILVVAEGVPITYDPEAIEWFTEVFSIKEERRIFNLMELEWLLRMEGFSVVTGWHFYVDGFNVRNWLVNSGLDKQRQDAIFHMHENAPTDVKKAHRMTGDKNCTIRTRIAILAAYR